MNHRFVTNESSIGFSLIYHCSLANDSSTGFFQWNNFLGEWLFDRFLFDERYFGELFMIDRVSANDSLIVLVSMSCISEAIDFLIGHSLMSVGSLMTYSFINSVIVKLMLQMFDFNSISMQLALQMFDSGTIIIRLALQMFDSVPSSYAWLFRRWIVSSSSFKRHFNCWILSSLSLSKHFNCWYFPVIQFRFRLRSSISSFFLW